MGELCHELRLWKRIASKNVLLCLAILIISILVDNNNVLCQEKKTSKISKFSKMGQTRKSKPTSLTNYVDSDYFVAPLYADEAWYDSDHAFPDPYAKTDFDSAEEYRDYIKNRYMVNNESTAFKFEELKELYSPFLLEHASNITMAQWAANDPVEDKCFVTLIDLNEIELKPEPSTYIPDKALKAMFISNFDEYATQKVDAFIKLYKEHVETNKVMTPLPSHYTLDDDVDIFYDDNMHEPLSSNKSSSSIDAGKNAEDIYGLKDNQFIFSSVMDGHGGPIIADLLKKWLPAYVKKNLMEKIINGKLKPRDIISSIENAHTELDQDFLEFSTGFTDEHSRFRPNGSCALSVLMDKHSYYVSNVGDSRSILLRSDSFVVLNNAHNISEPEEKEKMIKEHPEDKKLILVKRSSKDKDFPEVNQAIMPTSERHGSLGLFVQEPKQATYVKGLLQCTRSFGDFFLKDQHFATHLLNTRNTFPEPYTFPYITSLPEVHAIRRTKADQYLVLMSDGISTDLNDFNIYEIVKNYGFSIQEAGKVLIGASINNHAARASFDPMMLPTLDRNKRKYHDDSTVVILKLF